VHPEKCKAVFGQDARIDRSAFCLHKREAARKQTGDPPRAHLWQRGPENCVLLAFLGQDDIIHA
jgi:hypothetical protein